MRVTTSRSFRISFRRKRLGEGAYSMAMAPANCLLSGERKPLEFIEAGGRRHFETEIGVLTDQRQIAEFEERAARIPQPLKQDASLIPPLSWDIVSRGPRLRGSMH